MSKTEFCTPAERQFLDAFKDALNDSPAWGGWLSTFNGCRPNETMTRLRSVTAQLLQEDGRSGAVEIVYWLEWLAAEQGYDHA